MLKLWPTIMNNDHDIDTNIVMMIMSMMPVKIMRIQIIMNILMKEPPQHPNTLPA